ncbi:MAG: hypothetical protein HYW62_04290 [Candidatus Levybacteria bacterium]|nr:hypothetical protein [Candidatus Levybacteria bacterium]
MKGPELNRSLEEFARRLVDRKEAGGIARVPSDPTDIDTLIKLGIQQESDQRRANRIGEILNGFEVWEKLLAIQNEVWGGIGRIDGVTDQNGVTHGFRLAYPYDVAVERGSLTSAYLNGEQRAPSDGRNYYYVTTAAIDTSLGIVVREHDGDYPTKSTDPLGLCVAVYVPNLYAHDLQPRFNCRRAEFCVDPNAAPKVLDEFLDSYAIAMISGDEHDPLLIAARAHQARMNLRGNLDVLFTKPPQGAYSVALTDRRKGFVEKFVKDQDDVVLVSKDVSGQELTCYSPASLMTRRNFFVITASTAAGLALAGTGYASLLMLGEQRQAAKEAQLRYEEEIKRRLAESYSQALRDWVDRSTAFAKSHVKDARLHLSRSISFMVDPLYADNQLNWLLPALSERDLEAVDVKATSGRVMLKDSTNTQHVDLDTRPFPDEFLAPDEPKITLFQGENVIAHVLFSNKESQSTGGRHFMIIYFIDKNGRLVTEQEAANNLKSQGVWTRTETEAMAEKIHPKTNREQKRATYERSDNPELPFDFASVRSGTKYIVLDPNKPQPLPKYSGDSSTTTYVSTRGKVTINSSFWYTK